MTKKSKVFLASIAAAILVLLVVAIVAAVSFNLGKQSTQVTLEQPVQSTVSSSSDKDSEVVKDLEVVESPVAPPQQGLEFQGTSTPVIVTSTIEPGETIEFSPTATAVDTNNSNEPSQPTNISEADLQLLLEVWDIIDEEFDGQLPSPEDVSYAAVNGSLELLNDRFTRFVPPLLADTLREQLEGSFEGIGAFVDMTEDGQLLIVRPIQGQPADLAGLESGDIVIQVDGQDIQGMLLDEIIALVKGPRGTNVTLTVSREDVPEPFEVTITRDLIEIPIVQSELLDDDIGYVRLTSFSSRSATQLQDAIEELLSKNPIGLIVDLRDNPGGFLAQSVEVADLFLPNGIVLFQRDNAGNEEIFESNDGDIAEEIPLVVLINAGSASASEIVAGAIQDRGRGTLIGETTFGKGSVQHTHTLSDGSELRVTVARWYTPDNQSISEQGVVPDIEVDTPEIIGGEQDTQLQRAIDYLISLQ